MANESLIIQVRDDGSLVVKRNIEDIGKAGRTAKDGIDQMKRSITEAGAASLVTDSALSAMQRQIETVTSSNIQMAKSARDSADAFSTFDRSRAQVEALRSSYDPLFAASKRYEAAVNTLDNAMAMGVIKGQQYDAMLEQLAQQYLVTADASDAMSVKAGVAANAHANLFAQFNDIAVMLAAGQNPIQLALQQGTQISQVFQGLGNKPSEILRGIAGGFMMLLNPISLATIGIIAFGSYGIQALMSLWPEAEKLSDVMNDLSSEVQKYIDLSEIAAQNSVELSERFGSVGQRAKDMAMSIQEMQRADAIEKMDQALAMLTETYGGLSRTALTTSYSISGAGGVMNEISATMFTLAETFGLTTQQAAQLTLGLEQINNATTPADAIVAATRFSDLLLQMYGNASQVPPELRDMAIAAGEVALKGGEMLSAEEKLAAARQRNIVLAYQGYAASRVASNQALADAQVLLQAEQEKAQIAQLTLKYGSDSVQVRQAEQAIAMQALQMQVDALDVSQQIKNQIMAAAQATNNATNATYAWESAMAGVKAQLAAIASVLSSIGGGMISNASKQIEINALRAGKSAADARFEAAQAEIDMEYRARDAGAQNWFERAALWVDRGVRQHGLGLDRELAAEREAAAEREREASKKGGGGRGGAGGVAEDIKLQNKLIDSTIGDRQQFAEKLAAVNALLADAASGYSNQDAFAALSGDIGSDLFAGTQEAIDAQIERFQIMYDQIDMLRQADIISEQSAMQAKMAVNAKYDEMRVSGMSATFTELAKLSRSGNRTIAAIGKAAAVTQATIDGYLAIQKALASQPPPWNYALAAVIGATTAANVASILSTNTNFATGGSFDVGGAGGTDSQLIALRATPGEKVTVQTPAQVKKGSNAAAMGRDGQPAPALNARIINVVDPAMIKDYLATPEGEEVVINILGRNQDRVKQFANG